MTIAYGAKHFVSDDPHILQDRLAGFLRSKTPSAKHLARLIGCDPRTAEHLRADRWPCARTLGAIIRAFGADVWDVVFAPELAPVIADLKQKEAALERELEEVRARRLAAQGAVSRAADRVAAMADDEGE